MNTSVVAVVLLVAAVVRRQICVAFLVVLLDKLLCFLAIQLRKLYFLEALALVRKRKICYENQSHAFKYVTVMTFANSISATLEQIESSARQNEITCRQEMLLYLSFPRQHCRVSLCLLLSLAFRSAL